MAATKPFKLLIVLFTSLFLSVACAEQKSTQADRTDIPQDNFKSYSNNGLSLQYPNHWKFRYDSIDGLYADREVSLEIASGTVVNIFIYKTSGTTTTSIADRYVRIIKPKTSKHVSDFSRSSASIGGRPGEKIRWKDAMLFPFITEVSIVQVVKSPSPVFAVAEFMDEYIENETANFISVVNSITLNK